MNRVVITGLGAVAPNGVGLENYKNALQQGISGIRFFQHLQDANMGCCVAGVPPEYDDILLRQQMSAGAYKSLRSTTVKYALSSALEAWLDAGLPLNPTERDPETGCIFGNGVCDVDHMRYAIGVYESGGIQTLGTRHIEQLMTSGASAYVGGLLGLGNQVSANSSACSTGTEAVIVAFERIRSGEAKRMLAGSCEASSPYIWGVFDGMRVLNRNHNQTATQASRPMSADSAGFVPGSGAGALVLEDLELAKKRNAFIYAEVLSGWVNSGGQKAGGSMTAPGAAGVQDCIKKTIERAGISTAEIDLICAHLTGTGADRLEIANWCDALNRRGKEFPSINTIKSLTGHCISAAGSLECVAALLQMKYGFVQPNINCDNIHPDILAHIDASCIIRTPIKKEIKTIIKANFGFGDVNSCVIFKKFNS